MTKNNNLIAPKSSEELLLLVRFIQMLLSDSSLQKDSIELGKQFQRKFKVDVDSGCRVIEVLLIDIKQVELAEGLNRNPCKTIRQWLDHPNPHPFIEKKGTRKGKKRKEMKKIRKEKKIIKT